MTISMEIPIAIGIEEFFSIKKHESTTNKKI
jgi:hypothetical protein